MENQTDVLKYFLPSIEHVKNLVLLTGVSAKKRGREVDTLSAKKY